MRLTNSYKTRTALLLASSLAVITIVLSGLGYRVLASKLNLITETPIELPMPLSIFPKQIGDWSGKDVLIPETVQRVAKNDDFLSRLYVNNSNDEWVNIYVAYTARPRTMLGHRPEVCYVGQGWIHDSTTQLKLTSYSSREIPCMIHRFHTPSPNYDERVVLNFYLLNGQITSEEKGFSGLAWRTPNIAGDAARYVAQIQISSVLENPVRTATAQMADMILDFFPDENGEVRATEYSYIASD